MYVGTSLVLNDTLFYMHVISNSIKNMTGSKDILQYDIEYKSVRILLSEFYYRRNMSLF